MKTAQELRAGNVIMVGTEPMVILKATTAVLAVTARWSR